MSSAAIVRPVESLETFRISATDTNRMALIADPIRDKVPFTAIVEIFDSGGRFHGRIVRLLEDDPGSVCTQCTGARKGEPLVGMVFLTGLSADGDEFTGGEILDPDDGRTYRARIKLTDGGDKLKVRGFLGLSLFGRTQTWLRSQ